MSRKTGVGTLENISEERKLSLKEIFKESEKIAERALARMGESHYKSPHSFIYRLYRKIFYSD